MNSGNLLRPCLDRIPTEILWRIVGLAGSLAFLEVRSTSRQLRNKLSSLFLQRFIAHQVCFVLDSAQLSRLTTILSSRQWSEGLRTLCLTLSPLYPLTSLDIHLAAPSNHPGAHTIAQDDHMRHLIGGCMKRLRPPLEQIQVAVALRGLRSIRDCILSLHMSSHDSSDAQTITRSYPFDTIAHLPDDPTTSQFMSGPYLLPHSYSTGYHDLLASVVVEAECRIHKLEMDNRRYVDVQRLEAANPGALRRSMRSLQVLHLAISSIVWHHCHFEDSTSGLTTLRDIPFPLVQEQVMKASENLQDLRLVGDGSVAMVCCPESFLPDAIVIHSLLMDPPSFLTSLHLESVPVLEEDLRLMLERSGTMLKAIALYDITLDAVSCRSTLICLRDRCSKLERLRLARIFAQQPDRSFYPLILDAQAMAGQAPVNRPILGSGHYYDRPGVWPEDEHFLGVDGVWAIQQRLQYLCHSDHHYGDVATRLEGRATSETYDDWQAHHVCGSCGNVHGKSDAFGLRQTYTHTYTTINARLFQGELPDLPIVPSNCDV